MSILNRPSDGLFNLLIVLVRCIAGQGPMPRQKLLDLCSPQSVVSKQDMATKTLNRWLQLGLLEQDDAENVRPASELAAAVRSRCIDNESLAQQIRTLVLNESNNLRFWEAEDNGTADFTRGVAWMLAQNVFEFEIVGHSEVQKVEVEQLPDCAAFTNDTRWAGFKSWATFLGFGWTGCFPRSGVFVIDPTVAVRHALPQVFEGSRELTHSVFFSRLAEALPVLDDGEYRTQVESRINRSVWTAPEPDQVSTSLSRALLRLRDANELLLEARADADKRSLLGRGHKVVRNVSHVIWNGGQS